MERGKAMKKYIVLLIILFFVGGSAGVVRSNGQQDTKDSQAAVGNKKSKDAGKDEQGQNDANEPPKDENKSTKPTKKDYDDWASKEKGLLDAEKARDVAMKKFYKFKRARQSRDIKANLDGRRLVLDTSMKLKLVMEETSKKDFFLKFRLKEKKKAEAKTHDNIQEVIKAFSDAGGTYDELSTILEKRKQNKPKDSWDFMAGPFDKDTMVIFTGRLFADNYRVRSGYWVPIWLDYEKNDFIMMSAHPDSLIPVVETDADWKSEARDQFLESLRFEMKDMFRRGRLQGIASNASELAKKNLELEKCLKKRLENLKLRKSIEDTLAR